MIGLGLGAAGGFGTAGTVGSVAGATLSPALLMGGGLAAASAGTGIFNSYMNYKNFNLQKDNYKYQQQIQQDIFGREDNSVQRRIRDLNAAGLSPTLAAGSSAGAGSVVSTHAPQRDQMPDTALAVMSLLKQSQDISQSLAQKDYITEMTKNAIVNRTNAQAQLPNIMATLGLIKANAWNAATNAQKTKHDLSIFDEAGMPTNTGGFMAQLLALAGVTQKAGNKVINKPNPQITPIIKTQKEKVDHTKPYSKTNRPKFETEFK